MRWWCAFGRRRTESTPVFEVGGVVTGIREYGLRLLDEEADEMTADEAGAAGDEDR